MHRRTLPAATFHSVGAHRVCPLWNATRAITCHPQRIPHVPSSADIPHVMVTRPYQPRTLSVGARGYTPEITKVKIHRKVPLEIHRKFQPKSTGKVTISRNIPLESDNLLDRALKQLSGNAIENPRRFLRCRFLACNILPLIGPCRRFR